ncbi:hypothetical protein FEK30_01660 [Picosynechococcus sp. PCC 11901]|uniref:hypothetical protein n=1 Tax=Picosynechococcus sp. PCC 11901 TaxID=2579791 RepID=UPI0010FC1910|nr:hypothetical protein [Picosynechococcus sp. PCC 11901]QCS48244.1 hypothetical protein FEK30_01660 [Picosynechococcus sp. PCC 11901]
MTIAPRRQPSRTKRNRTSLLFERGMALLASTNLVLVLFDLSYIPLRNFWLQGRVQFYARIAKYEWKFPAEPVRILPVNVTHAYDWVKGIEENRDTAYYLQRVEDLQAKIQQINDLTLRSTGSNNGIVGSGDRQDITTQLRRYNQEQEAILADLRELSVEMVDTNPFEIANKTGTLEKIKNRMRRHVFGDASASSKDAFQLFWSSEYLSENGWREEFNFYEREIEPLLETNYFRPIGENGKYIDNFGILDFPFFLAFLLEFLARSWYISRRRTGVSWFDAMLWRWYDIFLLIPLFRWLRVIPVIVRLNQADLIDLSAIQKQASQGFVAGIAEDITEVVVIRIINQIQGSIHRGEFATLLAQTTSREYVDLNDINEPVELAKLMANLLVHQVLPKIQPEAEAVIRHTLDRVISMSPAYQGLQMLPGIGDLKGTLAKQLSHQLYQVTADTLKAVLEEDPVFEQLLEELLTQLTSSITSEIQGQESLAQMESLINDLLEEVKINYVERLSEEDVEDILEQTRALRQMTR